MTDPNTLIGAGGVPADNAIIIAGEGSSRPLPEDRNPREPQTGVAPDRPTPPVEPPRINREDQEANARALNERIMKLHKEQTKKIDVAVLRSFLIGYVGALSLFSGLPAVFPLALILVNSVLINRNLKDNELASESSRKALSRVQWASSFVAGYLTGTFFTAAPVHPFVQGVQETIKSLPGATKLGWRLQELGYTYDAINDYLGRTMTEQWANYGQPILEGIKHQPWVQNIQHTVDGIWNQSGINLQLPADTTPVDPMRSALEIRNDLP